jgi:hypothetical protein
MNKIKHHPSDEYKTGVVVVSLVLFYICFYHIFFKKNERTYLVDEEDPSEYII